MLEELYREIFVAGLMVGKQQRHLQHVETELGHPGGAIRLLEHIAVGEHLRAVERADIVKPEKAALEELSPHASSRLTHQVKLIRSF